MMKLNVRVYWGALAGVPEYETKLFAEVSNTTKVAQENLRKFCYFGGNIHDRFMDDVAYYESGVITYR